MFETSVVQAQVKAERRVGLLSMSVAAHVVVVVAVIGASIANVAFPASAPKEYAIPIFAAPPPTPPPALGSPDGGHKPQAAPPQQQKPAVTAPPADAAPSTIPQQVQPATSTGDPSATTTDAAGPGSDQPLGVPWGTKDGVGVDGPPSTATVEPPLAGPMRVVGDVQPPVVIHRVQPVYPRAAVAARLNGMVIVECIVDKTGRVRESHVLRSSSPLFESAAIEAVQRWQFTPGSLHGTAIDTIFDLTVTFRLTQ